MKKILPVITVLLLMATVSLGFVGCKKNTTETIKGEEVSEKAWDYFFDNLEDNDNWRLEIVESSKGVQNKEKFSMETKTTVTFDRGLAHVVIKYKISGDSVNSKILKVRYRDTEYYCDEDAGKYYHADGTEVTAEEKSVPGASYYKGTSYLDDMIPSTNYSNFRYDKGYKGYVYIANTATLWVLKFREGRLVATYTENKLYNTDYNNSESIDSYVVTYGGQTVRIP